ncbi:hypothetical protein H1S01_00270 [Heliobacterium chlorum]|uniref:Uncharacterized protein n=1 Tax=Heliobacterium chlorum TaxID=2698 RepID=A0ABR7SWL0_HELCL|nr:hypothetical protein [Heliobacterium chlorum]MBC9782942.1 hypothetical protein [Heliobacterium chlorum]
MSENSNDKNMDLMRKIIEQKKAKSANQGHKKGAKDGQSGPVFARPGVKTRKQGGLFDK